MAKPTAIKHSSRKNISRCVCETLESRIFLAAQISAATSAHLPGVVAFNAIASGYTGAGPSRVETVTVTDSGSSPLTFAAGAFSIVNDPTAAANAGNFTITNAGSLPSTLASGASATIDLQYNSTALYLQSALLQISSNDPTTPTLTINLHGIGTPGQFGTSEPSLVQVLRAHNIPTIVGAGPNDVNINVQKYPVSPDSSSTEVPMQRLVVANPGQPVTITPLAGFSAATQPVSRIGYYVPGEPNATTELFYINQSDAQTVDPTAQGATSFSPGASPFGLYGTFPGTTTSNGTLDTHYSEDALNVLDPTHGRKIRFFPLKNASGVVVANSFVFAVEDYNDPTTYNSFINFVGIVSNVQSASNASAGSTPSSPSGNNPPVMGLQVHQNSPGSSVLVFNTIKIPNSTSPDVVRNTNVVTINNTGDNPLTLNSLTLSDTQNWALVNPPAPGTQIAGGNSLSVTIQFIATTDPSHTNNQTNDIKTTNGLTPAAAGGVWHGTLTINSSDAIRPTQSVNLAGYWQDQSEHENEPNIATMTNLMFGYTTNATGSTGSQGTEFTNNGNTPILYGSEVDPSTNQGLLVSADGGAVSLFEVGAWHQQYVTPKANVGTDEVDIASAAESGTTVTIATGTPHGFSVGQKVTISGVGASGYNGTFTIVSVTSKTVFTYTAAAGLAAPSPTATQPQAGWYPAGGSTKFLYKDQVNNGQTMYPLLSPDSYSTVQTTFTPTGAFGLNLDGEKSQDAQNPADVTFNNSGHSIRFWPVIDASGNTVPNTWIVGLDYKNYVGPNSDYQDLFMILSNAAFEGVPATPVNLQATPASTGVNLQWSAMTTATGGYNLYQSSNGGAFTKLNHSPITSSNYTDVTAPAGATVKYQVTSINAAGVESLASAASINVASIGVPSSVTIQQADGSSGTQVVLSWTVSSLATSYNVQREDPGQSVFQTVATGLTATSFADSNVTGGASYQYQVQAVGTAGSSAYSSPASASVAVLQTAPAAPVIQLADGSSGTQVILTWASSAGATNYIVQRQDPGQSGFQVIASGIVGTTFTDSAVSNGQSYQYEVIAANNVGMSSVSAPVSTTVAVPQTAPPAPLVQSVDGSSGKQVVVTWQAAPGATSYTVQRKDPGQSVFQTIASSIAGITFTDANVMAGEIYVYQVIAVNAIGSSADSVPVSVSVAVVIDPPNTPANVQASSSVNSIAVSWSASSGASTYVVRREQPGDASFSDVATGLTATAYTDTNVLAGATYLYQVVAVNASGPSEPSSPPATATVPNGATLSVVLGKAENAFVQYVTSAGTVVTLKLTGVGAATIEFTADSISQAVSGKGMDVTGSNIAIALINATGTTASTTLTITTQGGNNTASIGALTADSSLGKIVASTASFIGAVSISGSVRDFNIGSATAAAISVGGSVGLFQIGVATGVTLNATGAIKTIAAGSWTSNHAVNAPSVGAIKIAGDAELNINSGTVHSLKVGGTLHDSTILLTAAGTVDLAALSATAITDSSLATAGNVGTISTTSLLNTQIFAGNGGQLPADFPLVNFHSDASISSILLKPTSGVVNDTNSYIAASSLKKLKLGRVKLNNSGAAFGVEANVINSLSFADSTVGKTETLTKLVSLASVAAQLASKGLNTADFKIEIV